MLNMEGNLRYVRICISIGYLVKVVIPRPKPNHDPTPRVGKSMRIWIVHNVLDWP
ncbi:hypothetical protein AALP_AA3G303500 [Arabis alpina]|uniref:Uncharacterized protein n=1 Tax=Arabis alpina TaxID=50452 RepID=A0A087HCP9_ARAAL|nr:hypothetical protein AALP_AA3G303500 [Arabis alpina]